MTLCLHVPQRLVINPKTPDPLRRVCNTYTSLKFKGKKEWMINIYNLTPDQTRSYMSLLLNRVVYFLQKKKCISCRSERDITHIVFTWKWSASIKWGFFGKNEEWKCMFTSWEKSVWRSVCTISGKLHNET